MTTYKKVQRLREAANKLPRGGIEFWQATYDWIEAGHGYLKERGWERDEWDDPETAWQHPQLGQHGLSWALELQAAQEQIPVDLLDDTRYDHGSR